MSSWLVGTFAAIGAFVTAAFLFLLLVFASCQVGFLCSTQEEFKAANPTACINNSGVKRFQYARSLGAIAVCRDNSVHKVNTP